MFQASDMSEAQAIAGFDETVVKRLKELAVGVKESAGAGKHGAADNYL
jgi:hypothetical protein